MVLSCAYDKQAGYIVSWDKDLLALGEIKGIKIVAVDEMHGVLKH